MTPSDIFGTIQPRPIYRTAQGHFRKETPLEFRNRHDDLAWANHQLNKLAVKLMKDSPWENLFKTRRMK